MYRFLLTRQWVILTLVGIALIPVMIRLGFWQLHRHEHRVARNQQIERALDGTPVPVEKLSAAGRDIPGADAWRAVSATGTYDPAGEVVVRQRKDADDQHYGYYVVTPLVLPDGKAVLVNRGWVAADGDDLTRYPKVPAPPSGTVTVTGRLRGDETTGNSGIKDKKGLPPRQVQLINSEQRAKDLGRPVLGGHIELTRQVAGQPQVVPEPDHSSIGPHLAYAIQWWLFSASSPTPRAGSSTTTTSPSGTPPGPRRASPT
ncbi:SURF1 family protein, partial [Streptomyces sp. NPDC049577]|uniref:SURF1 family cytochrome oxidase biogenesis protein n=1 Tax=Streptomyces sp. NPDC049577 TaxID=3155153 RepID=UPI00343C8358